MKNSTKIQAQVALGSLLSKKMTMIASKMLRKKIIPTKIESIFTKIPSLFFFLIAFFMYIGVILK